MIMRYILLLALALTASHALRAQVPPTNAPDTTMMEPGSVLPLTPWEFDAGLLAIFYRDTIALWNPSLTVDHGGLHLEARYNWEDWQTASLWVGYNFGFGEEFHVDLTPMAGAVFGNINGVAPGLLINAEWRSLSFYSSSEQFFDSEDDTGDFTYTWNELAVDLKLLSVGVVAQKTQTWESEREVQRGLLLMREQGNFNFGAYLFNFDTSKPTWAFTLSYGFGDKRSSTP